MIRPAVLTEHDLQTQNSLPTPATPLSSLTPAHREQAAQGPVEVVSEDDEVLRLRSLPNDPAPVEQPVEPGITVTPAVAGRGRAKPARQMDTSPDPIRRWAFER